MAAPAYTWEFKRDLWGQNRVPVVTALEASANLETKIGTLLIMASGQVDEAGGSVANVIGLALEAKGPMTAGDPIKVALLAPGMEIEGTADADATTLAGFNGKTIDLNADGSLDVADTAGGGLSVHRVLDTAGLQVACVVTKFALI